MAVEYDHTGFDVMSNPSGFASAMSGVALGHSTTIGDNEQQTAKARAVAIARQIIAAESSSSSLRILAEQYLRAVHMPEV